MIRDMTRGNVTRHLVSFSVPIILGNLFQLAYNAVDSIVVGRFAGTGALAAVGTANPVMNIFNSQSNFEHKKNAPVIGTNSIDRI